MSIRGNHAFRSCCSSVDIAFCALAISEFAAMFGFSLGNHSNGEEASTAKRTIGDAGRAAFEPAIGCGSVRGRPTVNSVDFGAVAPAQGLSGDFRPNCPNLSDSLATPRNLRTPVGQVRLESNSAISNHDKWLQCFYSHSSVHFHSGLIRGADPSPVLAVRQ